MIPLRDTIPNERKPVVVIFLIAVNTLVFLYQSILVEVDFARFIYSYGFIPQQFLESFTMLSPSGFYTLFTGMFLHGSWFHLISNMWILWLFGDNVEDRLGHVRFFIFYVLCGITANLSHLIFSPMSGIPAVGASGAIAGVMGAYFILFPTSRITTLIPILFFPLFIQIPAVTYLIIWFLIQLYSGTVHVLSGGRLVEGIAWWAHIGGFIGGIVLHRFFIRTNRSTPFNHDKPLDWNKR